jgi:large conductance mechanosensitive channel
MSEGSQKEMLKVLKQIQENTKPKPAPKPKKAEGFMEEFTAFLKKYGVIGLAIAFIIGGAAGRLVSSLVADIMMPIITFFLPGGAWREAVWLIGPVQLAVGSFLAAVIDFLVIALIVFILMKQLEKTSLA